MYYILNKTSINPETGSIEEQQPLKLSLSLEACQKAMRDDFEKTLSELNLTENDVCDENGDSVPGGYISNVDAGIYCFAEFANDQLLELVSYTICMLEEDSGDGEQEETKDYYRVEVSICGSILVEATSEEAASDYVESGLSSNDPDVLELLGDMARQHIESGDVDIGECYPAD